jgi:hypothetical protein
LKLFLERILRLLFYLYKLLWRAGWAYFLPVEAVAGELAGLIFYL